MIVMTLAGLAVAQADPPLRVGRVEIIRDPIFLVSEVEEAGGLNGLLRRTMNRLHIDTSARVLRGELLFREGDAYRPELLAETERNLRALGFLADVEVAAVDTTADGRVGVRVRTRESWTLETSVSFSLAGGDARRWNLQLSDENFLGRGVQVGGGIGEDEDETYWNLWYKRRRIADTRLLLGVEYARRSDGESTKLQLSRPFFALDDATAVELEVWDASWERRVYLSNAGPAGADPTRAASLYSRAPYRERGWQLAVQRRLSPVGEGRIWRLGAGVRVRREEFHLTTVPAPLSDGREAPLAWLLADGAPLARRQGTTAFPFLWLRTTGRTWVETRYVLDYGTIEDLPLGWDVDLKLGPAGGVAGSTAAWGHQRWRGEAGAVKWTPVLGGLHLLQLHGRAELGRPAVRNHDYECVTGWVGSTGRADAPWLGRVFAAWAQGAGLAGSRALVLGLDNGLRTLEYDGMAGDRRVRWNAEVGRATPWRPAGLFRLGLAAFYGGGGAWWRDESHSATDLRHEFGVGLRFGPTRSSGTRTARLDLAFDAAGGGPVVAAVTGGLF